MTKRTSLYSKLLVIPIMAMFGHVLRSSLVILVLSGSMLVHAEGFQDSTSLGFVKGYTWGWDGRHGDYASPQAQDSMTKMADLGCNWICIAFGTSMSAYDNPQFRWSTNNPYMVSDEDIRAAIAQARKLKLKIILKPVVNSRDGVWRAWIRFFRPVTDEEKTQGIHGEYDPWGDTPGIRKGMVIDEKAWSKWWENYTEFLKHYAKIAQDEQVELFCLGCEMNSTEDQVEQWRSVIKDVRNIYCGQLTYNANHGREKDLVWWDMVDVISISAYYPVDPPPGKPLEEAVKQTTSKSEIVAALNGIKQELAELSTKLHKPILFIETGVTSVRGCARYPWSHGDAHPESPIDQQEQVNFYEAMLEVFWNEPWFMGYTWWDWPAKLYLDSDAVDNRGFCVYGKPAENVLREWYAKPTAVRTSP
ncbi:glycoside hydrolase family 113 [Bythopirellula polymerisocia]|uniref:Uncharacterized protein n=1 Tax=Bythopirellula polymerisocia TaxID=2528003 RepID=A0A5C6CXD2_9BACT|nr:glycosyl hydrolase family 53 [Bythopirellula polymerisocia]TWU29252.1 hypothetical protein Pla144_00280 [Bythopirellula polymerisocia]